VQALNALGTAIAIAIVIVVSACSTTPGAECGAGDYRYCDCPSGRQGYAQCSNDGAGYGACDCSGAIPAGAGVLVEAGSPDAADAAPASSGEFLSSCAEDSECASRLCFAFNAYGLHCTMACAKDLDCPAPSPGCSMMKVCKIH
jgi:hypothetical protein